MARHNHVSLIGFVINEPSIVDLGVKKRGAFIIQVIRADRNAFDGDAFSKITNATVVTSNPELVEIIEDLHENDIVSIKSNIITVPITKAVECPHCESENTYESLFAYINPVAMCPLKKGLSKGEAMEYLEKNKEFSNEVTIIGHLCHDPEKIASLKKVQLSQYKIGIPRKFNIKWDENSDSKADFPYIKSYGQNSEKDLTYLKKGSTVLIDGFLQTRYFERKKSCSHCSKDINWADSTLEVIAYSTEYLKNLKLGNDIDEDVSVINESTN